MAAPVILCSTKGMDRRTWLACRQHGPDGSIPYTLGGSDISAMFDLSPWKTRLELWMEKKGLLAVDDSSNAAQKAMGQLMEPIVAHWYGVKTGNAVLEDTNLYQHAAYPWALANIDYGATKKGVQGGLECKTTSYHKAGDWADGALPYYYEYQARFYMAVKDMPFWDVCCLWGNNPEEDMAVRELERDPFKEGEIMDAGSAFIQSLHDNEPPTMSDAEPKLALKALARIYGNSVKGQPTIEFSRKYENTIRRIASLQQELRELHTLSDRKEKEVEALSVRIAEVMKDHEYGVLETASEKFKIDFVTKVKRMPDTQKLKQIYGAAYWDYTKPSYSRKVKVSVV